MDQHTESSGGHSGQEVQGRSSGDGGGAGGDSSEMHGCRPGGAPHNAASATDVGAGSDVAMPQ